MRHLCRLLPDPSIPLLPDPLPIYLYSILTPVCTLIVKTIQRSMYASHLLLCVCGRQVILLDPTVVPPQGAAFPSPGLSVPIGPWPQVAFHTPLASCQGLSQP